MSEQVPPGASTSTRREPSPPRRQRIRILAGAVLLVGLLAPILGVGYAVHGLAQVSGSVDVSVHTRAGSVLEVPGTTPAGNDAAVLVRTSGEGQLRLNIPGVDPSVWLNTQTDELILSAGNSTVAEQLLNRAGLAIVCLCVGAGCVLLRRLLLSIADGRPFEPGNAPRITKLAGLLVAGSLAHDVLPALASFLVVMRLGLASANRPIFVELGIELTPLFIGLLLLALSEAFRRGAELTGTASGLVDSPGRPG